VRNAVPMQGIVDRTGFLLCVPGMSGLSVCWLDGDGNFGVDRGWCGWVSGRLCVLGSHPSSYICRYPEKGGDLLLIFPL